MERIRTSFLLTLIGTICLIIIFATGEDNFEEYFSPQMMAGKFFACGLVLIVGAIYGTLSFLKSEQIIFEIEGEPLRTTDQAREGAPFAGEGIIENEEGKILFSPYTNTPCVYYHSIREIEKRRGRSSEWRIIQNKVGFIPFYFKDKYGRLKIDLTNMDDDFSGYKIEPLNRNIPNPKNSEIDCELILDHVYTTRHPGVKGILFGGTRYREKEFVLRPGTKVFVYGMVSKGFVSGGVIPERKELVLHEDEKHPLIISRKKRDQYCEEFSKGEDLVYLVHVLIMIGYTLTILSLGYLINLKPSFLFVLLPAGNFIILGSMLFSLYNRIITLKNRALNALSNIDVELKRRADLISNLVEIVKGYAKHEKEIQEIISKSRAQISFSKQMLKDESFIISPLVAVVENYPQLRASGNFKSLMRTLFDTEERIAYCREFYNRTVRKYNSIINQFPFILISLPLGFKEMNFITIKRG